MLALLRVCSNIGSSDGALCPSRGAQVRKRLCLGSCHVSAILYVLWLTSQLRTVCGYVTAALHPAVTLC